MTNNIKLYFVDMPVRIRAFTQYDGTDDYYTIFVNARHSRQTQIDAYLHELEHIIGDDFVRDDHINLIESMRHHEREMATCG